MVTIKDLAKILKVSPSTVSMALNDNPRVSEKTRKKVKALAKKMQYHPNLIARAMVQKKTNLIGLIITDIQSSFFPQIIQGIEDVISEKNYSAILCSTNNDLEREREYMRLMRQKKVDGIIAEPVESGDNADIWQEMVDREIPIVSILNTPPVEKITQVKVDNVHGAFIATEHLIKSGHKTIAHLAGPQKYQISRDRLKGFKKALKKHKLKCHDNLILETTFDWETGYNNMRQMLQRKPRPTAVFCAGDIIAIGASYALRQAGYGVPSDIAVIGFDDLFLASIAEVPLTTVAQPKYNLGELSARKLLELIDGKEADSEILEPTMTIRNSCGCLSKDGKQHATAADFKLQYKQKG